MSLAVQWLRLSASTVRRCHSWLVKILNAVWSKKNPKEFIDYYNE